LISDNIANVIHLNINRRMVVLDKYYRMN